MWSNLFSVFIPILLMFCGMGVTVAIAYIWKRKQDLKQRQSPLTQDLMRPPGYSLRLKVNEQSDEVTILFIFMLITPLLLYSLHLSQSYFGQIPESLPRTIIMLVIGLGTITLLGRRLSKVLNERKNNSLGFQGEMFTGEELNQLMLYGCRVFHDIQIDYGNIDHVVVSPSGVFSINTKMRSKAKEGKGKAEVIVDHQNNVLRFSDRSEKIDVDQLETEGRWLSKYLTSSVGMQIPVRPVLALPGWFVKQNNRRGSFSVINPKNSKWFFMNDQVELTSKEILQVAHQLGQLCRDVEPVFRDKK
ncbi:NERD domain-containing protein [Gimesia benthica]|uniref:NERD domain-containing protein n=1 Tax=Gimesia benthica TaxID=2608982 RepID=A0A6I6AC40_9PLAN|nr:nuclease-related domain-containing protein [Gimesia benthica]QGQ23943.1 NERD domain-containing protein [Gimesia benthica]